MSGSGKTKGRLQLTSKTVWALKPAGEPYRISDSSCVGLAIRIAPSGLKTWDLSFRIRGLRKTKRLSLGSIEDCNLKDARDRANEITKAGRAGRDLLAEEEKFKIELQERVTVEKLIDEYIERRVEGRLRTSKEIKSRLKRSLLPFLNKAANEIKRRDIRQILDQVADKGLLREAERRRQTIGTMFRWALSQDFVETDPTAGLVAYSGGKFRDRVLADAEVRSLWHALESAKFPRDTADVIRLQLALGARCGEIGGMSVEEIDQTAWIWTLPAERSKNKKARATPLVGLAKEIVMKRIQEKKSGFLFVTEIGNAITAAHVGHKLMNRFEKMGIAHFSTHDIRRTCATKWYEMGFRPDHIAATLGHDLGHSTGTRVLVTHYLLLRFPQRKKYPSNKMELVSIRIDRRAGLQQRA